MKKGFGKAPIGEIVRKPKTRLRKSGDVDGATFANVKAKGEINMYTVIKFRRVLIAIMMAGLGSAAAHAAETLRVTNIVFFADGSPVELLMEDDGTGVVGIRVGEPVRSDPDAPRVGQWVSVRIGGGRDEAKHRVSRHRRRGAWAGER